MTQRFHLIWPLVALSLALAVLSVVAAVGLVREQRVAAADLRIDVDRHRQAVELEECFVELAGLIRDRVRTVDALHDRAAKLLRESRAHVMDPTEQARISKIEAEFQAHQLQWNTLPVEKLEIDSADVPRFSAHVEHGMIRPSHEFEVACSQRLQLSADQHSQLLRRTTWGLILVGGSGGVAGLVFGFGVSQGVSRSIRRLQVQVRDAAGKLDPSAAEILLTADGSVVALQDEMDSLMSRIERFVATLQQRDQEVLRAEQLAALGQLAAGVAHEVRNPLTSIKLLVQAELTESSKGGMSAEDLKIIEQEVLRMERSLQSFLDYARLTDPERRMIDLATAVQSVMGLVRVRASQQRVMLQLNSPDNGVQVSADMNQMQQVLLNLMLNALDAMPQGGRITVTLTSTADHAELTVDDTGPGISTSMASRLFQPFATTKETGLGLGLVMARRIVEAHLGEMSVESNKGAGARFRIRLPFHTPSVTGDLK